MPALWWRLPHRARPGGAPATTPGATPVKQTMEAFLNELGEELLGLQWVWMRPHIEHWLHKYPEKAAWLDHRLCNYGRRRP
jgi:hypothetical protein